MSKTKLTEYEALELFDEYLDELQEPVTILGMTYALSKVLKECDPIAYRVTFNEWVDYVSDDYSIEGYTDDEDEETE